MKEKIVKLEMLSSKLYKSRNTEIKMFYTSECIKLLTEIIKEDVIKC